VTSKPRRIDQQLGLAAIDNLVQKCCGAVVEGALPISVIEQPWFYDVLQAAVRYGHESRNVKVPSLQGTLPKRRQFTPKVDEYCESNIERFLNPVRESAKHSGATFISDGRSNQRNDPLIVGGVETRYRYAPLGAVNAGLSKKDAAYLVNYVKRHLDDRDLGNGFGDSIIATVMDGAPACINAIKLLAQLEKLLAVRCQSHLLALAIKRIMLKCFADTIDEAGKLIQYIRNHGRVHSILKSLAKYTIFRFVETRFNTHVIALNRLLLLKSGLTTLPVNEEFQAYIDSQSGSERASVEILLASTVKNPKFWLGVEFAVHVCMPLTRALRMVDRSRVRARHIKNIWTVLEDHLAVALVDGKYKDYCKVKRIQIFRNFLKTRVEISDYPIFNAAFALDPCNWDQIRRLQSSEEADDIEEWAQVKSDTLDCIELVTRRTNKNKTVSEIDAAIESCIDEFLSYASVGQAFANASHTTPDPYVFWERYGKRLKFVAVKILDVAATISDIERTHKSYGLIHTPARNRLADERVDRLVLALLSQREERREEKPLFNEKFELPKLSSEQEADLVAWGEMQRAADKSTAKVIQEPTASVIAVDVAPLALEEADDPIEPQLENVSAGTADSQDDASSSSSSDSDSDDESITGATSPALPARRQIRITQRFKEAGLELGLTEASMFKRTSRKQGKLGDTAGI